MNFKEESLLLRTRRYQECSEDGEGRDGRLRVRGDEGVGEGRGEGVEEGGREVFSMVCLKLPG